MYTDTDETTEVLCAGVDNISGVGGSVVMVHVTDGSGVRRVLYAGARVLDVIWAGGWFDFHMDGGMVVAVS